MRQSGDAGAGDRVVGVAGRHAAGRWRHRSGHERWLAGIEARWACWGGVAPSDEVIYESRPRQWKHVVFAVVFVLLGWLLVAVVSRDEGFRGHEVATPVGVLTIAFGLAVLVVLVPRVLRRHPVLTLSDVGFIDGSPMGGGIFVPWCEVTEISLVRYGSIKNIAGRVARPERLWSDKRGLARWISRLNRRHADFCIADSTLPEPAEAVMERMSARWRLALGHKE